MIEFPPAKLNLGLQIIAKRTDGYHDLQTVFYQFPLNDVLEIIKDDSLEPGQCRLISSGLPIPGGENLCEKAYKLLHKSHPLPGVRIYLHKIIPMGAGLGGGSSDAAYTLKLLNTMFDLKLSNDELKAFALILGSDCPLFIDDKPQYAEGRGELLSSVNINLTGKYLLQKRQPQRERRRQHPRLRHLRKRLFQKILKRTRKTILSMRCHRMRLQPSPSALINSCLS